MTSQSLLARIRESRLFWPLAALAVILLFDAIFEPGFFKIGIIEDPVYGPHLYGNLIDVLNNGAPLMLVSIGMTLVIATAGVDLSVGAVIAISAARNTSSRVPRPSHVPSMRDEQPKASSTAAHTAVSPPMSR